VATSRNQFSAALRYFLLSKHEIHFIVSQFQICDAFRKADLRQLFFSLTVLSQSTPTFGFAKQHEAVTFGEAFALILARTVACTQYVELAMTTLRRDMLLDDSDLFAGTSRTVLWRKRLSE
jgi:hypothetical protein